MKLCIIDGEIKLGSNERGETFIWWNEGQRWLNMEEFQKCEIKPGTKFILQIQNEKVKIKNASPSAYSTSAIPFSTNIDYSISPSPLKLEDMRMIQYEQQPESEATPTPPPDPTSITDLFVGGAATLAMILSVAQQVRQKKKEAEANLCCNNNKIEITKFDAKLQKLETEIKAKSEKDNKGMIAEILETRKEIKDIKEEFASGKEDLQKIIEIIELQSKNK